MLTIFRFAPSSTFLSTLCNNDFSPSFSDKSIFEIRNFRQLLPVFFKFSNDATDPSAARDKGCGWHFKSSSSVSVLFQHGIRRQFCNSDVDLINSSSLPSIGPSSNATFSSVFNSSTNSWKINFKNKLENVNFYNNFSSRSQNNLNFTSTYANNIYFQFKQNIFSSKYERNNWSTVKYAHRRRNSRYTFLLLHLQPFHRFLRLLFFLFSPFFLLFPPAFLFVFVVIDAFFFIFYALNTNVEAAQFYFQLEWICYLLKRKSITQSNLKTIPEKTFKKKQKISLQSV